MTFIDWSDSEGMLDLFQEFLRDEMSACSADTERHRFLNQLAADVGSVREAGIEDAIPSLRTILESIQGEFRADPASLHLADLIGELEGLT